MSNVGPPSSYPDLWSWFVAWFDATQLPPPTPGQTGGPDMPYTPWSPLPDGSPPWAYPDDPHAVDGIIYPGGSGSTGGSSRKGGSKRARNPKAVLIHPAAGAGSAGKATQAYPMASQTTGGAMPILEMDALSLVGVTPALAELVGRGMVTLGATLSAWQREQDRVTNRTWRRPGGLQRPAGL